MKKILAVALLAALALPARAEDAARPYDWLNTTTLPPPGKIIEAALDALPKSLAQQKDWLARIRRAAWYPQLSLQYRAGEAVIRNFQTVDRIEHTTGSESTRSSGRDTELRSSLSSSTRNSTTTDSGGSLSESQTDTDSGSGSETLSSRSSSAERRSISSTTMRGPDSYATGEDFHWANEIGVLLTWDLSRFVFQEGELRVADAEISLEKFRQEVKIQTIETYYDLEEALRLLSNDTYKDSIPTQVRKERAAFMLDTLTGGYLSQSAGRAAP